MIPKDIIDRIYTTAKIEEVVGDYVSLKRRGGNLWGLCPFPDHTEKTPSFSVNPARNIYKCFGCGKGGNAINFVIAMEQCSYPEALRKVAKKYNIEVPEREMTEEEQQRHDDKESMSVVNEWANQWYQKQLWETQEGQTIGLSYYHQRGLRDETIRRFQLGYSPAKGYMLPKAAKEAGYEEKYLINDPETGIGTGICGRSSGKDGEEKKAPSLYDRYRGRVIFPINGVSGKTVGFAGRIIEKNDNVGKYVNSPESLVYSKKKELYGLYQAKAAIIKQKMCYLVEGQMDCIAMSQAGIENVVCSGGTSLTPNQIQLIHRFTDKVTILYDGDAAGIHAALRGIDMFLEENMYVNVMLFPDGDDPDSFSRKHTSDEFRAYIEKHEEDFIRYKTRTLLHEAGRDARKQSEAIHSIINSIALIHDSVTRNVYIKEFAQTIKWEESKILIEVSKVRKEHYQEEQRKRNEQKQQADAATPQAVTDPGYGPIIGVDDEPAQSTTPAETPLGDNSTGEMTADQIAEHNARNIIRALVKYGHLDLLLSASDGTPITIQVGAYIQQYLAATGIELQNPLYRRCLEEYNLHKEEPNFDATSFFTNHPDQAISGLTVDLLSDPYALVGAVEEEATPNNCELTNLVSHLMYELHYITVEQKLNELDAYLEKANQAQDEQALMLGLSQQQQLLTLKKNISQLLGKY